MRVKCWRIPVTFGIHFFFFWAGLFVCLFVYMCVFVCVLGCECASLCSRYGQFYDMDLQLRADFASQPALLAAMPPFPPRVAKVFQDHMDVGFVEVQSCVGCGCMRDTHRYFVLFDNLKVLSLLRLLVVHTTGTKSAVGELCQENVAMLTCGTQQKFLGFHRSCLTLWTNKVCHASDPNRAIDKQHVP
jgi:hypothetical protein